MGRRDSFACGSISLCVDKFVVTFDEKEPGSRGNTVVLPYNAIQLCVLFIAGFWGYFIKLGVF